MKPGFQAKKCGAKKWGICLHLFALTSFCLIPVRLCAQPFATNTIIYPSPSGPYLHVEWQGIEPGHSYTLQFSADVVHWFPLDTVTNTCSTNAAWVQNTPLAGHPKCFFRMQEDLQ